MKKYINGQEVQYKQISCGLNGAQGVGITEPYINLYVVVTRDCNVRCKFCTFCEKGVTFDILKFKKGIDAISKEFKIGKVSFTGGEPTLNIPAIKEALSILKKKDKDIFTSVNTNGTNLKALEGLEDLDNIALSRHAILEEDNKFIMGVPNKNILKDKDILDFTEKGKLHLSCNLIKGYVDNASSVEDYLEFASKLGVDDVGFVSLMPVNKYAEDNFIDFKDIDFKGNLNIINNKVYLKEEQGVHVCRCNNYLYKAKKGNIIAFYSRYVVKRDAIIDYLVFEDGNFTQGFNGKVII